MADVHKGLDHSTGIKLFGKTITVQVMKEEEEEDENKKPDKIIPCPRCKSMDTKFCYFNNYNVNQPRHFCKSCQRYWTAGGALRNVPVGAGRRRNRPPDTFSDGSSFEDVHFDGVVGEWCMAVHGDYQHVFPAKRRRTISGDF